MFSCNQVLSISVRLPLMHSRVVKGQTHRLHNGQEAVCPLPYKQTIANFGGVPPVKFAMQLHDRDAGKKIAKVMWLPYTNQGAMNKKRTFWPFLIKRENHVRTLASAPNSKPDINGTTSPS